MGRGFETVLDRGLLPGLGNTRLDEQFVAALLEAEYCLERNAIHPARRARVPGPAASPEVAFRGIDIRCNDVGLDFVNVDTLRAISVRDWIDHLEQLERPVA